MCSSLLLTLILLVLTTAITDLTFLLSLLESYKALVFLVRKVLRGNTHCFVNVTTSLFPIHCSFECKDLRKEPLHLYVL